MSTNRFWHIGSAGVGDTFTDRDALSKSGIHRPRQKGIWGRQDEGVESIVLSGGYEDDRDFGDVILYTGEGGQDPVSRQHVHDQELTGGNRALAVNVLYGFAVRVVRGKGATQFSPTSGYRYDGLYIPSDVWRERGRSGHFVWRYRLDALSGESSRLRDSTRLSEQGRKAVTEVVFSPSVMASEAPRRVREIHGSRCQVCGECVNTPLGPLAELVFLQPPHVPHDGPNIESNLLCLCPSHANLLRRGFISVHDDGSLVGLAGSLRMHRDHRVGAGFARYHREHLLLVW